MRTPPLVAATLAVLLAAGACRSSAPYTLPSAALNTGLAVGAALGQRAAGGCYANCPPGTRCNPATGYCDSTVELCVGTDASSPACARGGRGSSAAVAAEPGAAPGTGTSGLGISPATGRAPAAATERPGASGP